MSATAKHKGKTVVPDINKILGVQQKISHTKQYRYSSAAERLKHRRSSNSMCITSERLMVIAL